MPYWIIIIMHARYQADLKNHIQWLIIVKIPYKARVIGPACEISFSGWAKYCPHALPINQGVNRLTDGSMQIISQGIGGSQSYRLTPPYHRAYVYDLKEA